MSARLLPLLCLLVACGDDARLADGRSEGASTADGDAAHVSTNPVSDAGLVYTFPCIGKREATYEATFASVYLDVFCGAGCVNPYCHGSRGTWGDLDLASSIEVAYSQLVEHRTGLSTPADLRPTCRDSDLLRVVPGSPEQSLLYLKITASAPCGTRMPPPSSGLASLSRAQVEQIRSWIAAGAPLDNRAAAGAEDAGESTLDGAVDSGL